MGLKATWFLNIETGNVSVWVGDTGIGIGILKKEEIEKILSKELAEIALSKEWAKR